MKFGILFLSPFISNKQQTNGITRTVTHPIQLKNFIFESRKVIDLEIWAKNVRMLGSWEGRSCSSFLHNFINFPLRTCSVLPDLATYHTWDGRKMKRRIHKKNTMSTLICSFCAFSHYIVLCSSFLRCIFRPIFILWCFRYHDLIYFIFVWMQFLTLFCKKLHRE